MSTGDNNKSGKKLQLAMSAARAQLSPWLQRVAEFMLLKPTQQAARIVEVIVPVAASAQPFHNAGPDPIKRKVKELGDVPLAHRLAVMAVYALIDDPALGYWIMGYSVAPDARDMTRAEHFRPFSARQLGTFHAKALNKKQHYRDARTDQQLVPHTHAGQTFDYPEFDPRFIVTHWLTTLKPAADAAAGAGAGAASSASSDDGDDAKSAPAPAVKTAPVPPPTGPAEVAAPATNSLAEKQTLVAAAERLLPRLLGERVIEVVDEQTMTLAETQRIGFFPRDFEVDIERLFAASARGGDWAPWPLAAAFLVAANPDLYPLQGFFRFLRAHDSQGSNGTSLRSDMLTRALDMWSRNAVAGTWDQVTLAAELYAAPKALELLADLDSGIFKRARAWIAVAELADRVLKVTHATTVPTDGRVCAFSGAALPGGSTATAVDVALRATVKTFKYVRVWLSSTIRDWLPTDPAPSKREPLHEEGTSSPKKKPAQAPAASKKRERAPQEEGNSSPKKKRRKAPSVAFAASTAAPTWGAFAGCSTFRVDCDAVWHTMRQRQQQQQQQADSVLLDAYRAALQAPTKAALDDALTNSLTQTQFYALVDVAYRFVKPHAPSVRSIMDSDGEGEDEGETRPTTVLPSAPLFALGRLVAGGTRERSSPERARPATLPAAFEKRFPTAASLEFLAATEPEWAAFAALFGTEAQ